ncbi:MAG: helix-turn-helix domain-containing protein [Deltaproteobacteria bacterium]
MGRSADVEVQVVAALKELGLTATEGKAYVALLKNHPATGYELAARSQVPRSAIYGVLKKLEAVGLINAIQQKPAKFVPLPPKRLLELMESRFRQNLDTLEGALSQFSVEGPDTVTWTFVGYGPMLEQARALIERTDRTLYVSAWRREILALEAPLKAAVANGIDVVVFSFNRLPQGIGRTFAYDIPEDELEAYWPHRIILVGDRRHLLVGGAEATEDNRSVVTEETPLIEVAVSNLVLDLTLYGQRTGTDLGPVIERLTPPLPPVEALIPRASGLTPA